MNDPSAQTVALDGSVAVVGAAEHPHAARRLRAALPGVRWVPDPAGEVSGPTRVVLRIDQERPEGAFSISVRSADAETLIEIVGGPFSGVIYGVEDLVGRLARRTSAGWEIPLGVWEDAPGLRYRTLWTWDHSTNWWLDQIGLQEIGALNTYTKRPEAFLEDYRRLVDFMSRERIAAVVVYGLLRDAHGGVAAARELCTYANERGVRILAGVGINAYGGIYFDGDHQFNLATWLRKRPDLAARAARPSGFVIDDYGYLSFPRSEYMVAACPSQPDNLRWHEEAIAWLIETLPIGGINFETGDYGTCECERCGSRPHGSATWSYEAMRSVYPRLLEASARASGDGPDRWDVIEMYWDNILDVAAQAPLAVLSDDAVYQYCVNRSYWPRLRASLDRSLVGGLPHTRNVLRTHMASQWNRERYAFVGADLAGMAASAAVSGLLGLTIFGEASAYNPPNELNYLAFSRFGWDPTLTWTSFVRDEIEPRFGGREPAERFFALLRLLDDPSSPARLGAAGGEARSIGASLPADEERRWLWLEERLARSAYSAT